MLVAAPLHRSEPSSKMSTTRLAPLATTTAAPDIQVDLATGVAIAIRAVVTATGAAYQASIASIQEQAARTFDRRDKLRGAIYLLVCVRSLLFWIYSMVFMTR